MSQVTSETPPASRRCPTCGRPAQQMTRPFCSRRCADIDLGRWLGGGYRIVGRPPEDEDADLPSDTPGVP